MTTLAIIGGGIAGRSLLYVLSRENGPFDKVLLFESDSFAFPCSLRSTAISAQRGVTLGHSSLGDLIVDGFSIFRQHAESDRPEGVHPIELFSGAKSKLAPFRQRYPHGEERAEVAGIGLHAPVYFAQEKAFMIDPPVYLSWLLSEAKKKLPLQLVPEFITEFKAGEKVLLKTQAGSVFEADQVVFAAGAASRFWKPLFPESKLKSSKPVQGAYLEFSGVGWERPSFALTLEGCSLIYHAHSKRLLIGSTSQECSHNIPDLEELKKIYSILDSALEITLPSFEEGKVMVGHREKARKREPYVFTEGNVSFIGGFYKNGFTLALKMTRSLSHRLRASV